MSDDTVEHIWQFKVELDGEDAYVIETPYGDHGSIKWGPMHRDKAGPFIDERNEMLVKLGRRVFQEVKRHFGIEAKNQPPAPEGTGGE
jgi:hypothetical protein